MRVWDWSETSQTVSIFSREHGLIRAVAKGAKRDNARFSGGLGVLTRGEFTASLKQGEQLSLLTSWDLVELFPGARESLSAFYAGMAVLDVAHHSVHDHDPHPKVYDALVAALRSLAGGGEQWALLRFLWSVLRETGHRPELWRDAAGGMPLEPAQAYVFAPLLGGLVNASHPDLRGDEWRVRSQTIDLLRSVGEGREMTACAGDPEAVDRACRLLAAYFRECFATEPAALRPWLTPAPRPPR